MDENEVDSHFVRNLNYLGTWSRNNLPKTRVRPAYMIVNSDGKFEPGEHWATVILLSGSKGLYFDPFGFPPLHPDLQSYMHRACPNGFEYSCQSLQHVDSVRCGLFCIAFIKLFMKGYSYNEILSLFCTTLKHNDELLDCVKK